MAINMMCMNGKCKYYWEDSCTRNLEEKRTVINSYGQCETFEKGVSDYYEEMAEKQTLNKSIEVCIRHICDCNKGIDNIYNPSSNFEYVGCEENNDPVFKCKDCGVCVYG